VYLSGQETQQFPGVIDLTLLILGISYGHFRHRNQEEAYQATFTFSFSDACAATKKGYVGREGVF